MCPPNSHGDECYPQTQTLGTVSAQISDALTDEVVRNGSIKKVEKRGNVGEPSNDKNGRDDNKRTRTGNAFPTTVNPIERENTGTWPKCTTCNSFHAPGGPCRTCFNYNRPGHLAKDYRGVPRNVNPINTRNPTVRACYECGSTDHGQDQGRENQGNQARGRAFMLGAEEARQDPNIVTKYEKTRADSNNTSGSGSANTGGTVALDVHGCSYKTFTNDKPHTFNGTEGVVGLKRWFEKMEQVFEICKCAEDDKVKFVVCTFEGRALTWWNGNVQTLGLANANQIPWSNVKAMMTTEYCPATEIQRMEQELWTLTLKGDDIEAYNNRFHELVLMCPELVSTEKKKIEKYIRGFPEGIKGNVTSSKPATLHDAINMARELIEQGVQAKALRIGDSNKRKWEDQQGNNYHQQQNRRQEAAKVYVAAPAKGRGYAGNLPWCNRCKAHHQPGPCPPRCGKCHKLGHQEGECRTRIPVAGGNSLQNVTCFGCGNHGHYRSDCPELKNRN
ncbi:putative reverse transcriptase domain-containing protein [Tanacetum coccineum]